EMRRLDVSMEKAVHVAGAIAIPAQPLRTLYLESDRVVAAQVGKSTEVKRDGDSRLVVTTLAVSGPIKGDGSKTALNVDHSVYGRGRGQFKEGEVVLAFLQRTDESEARKDPNGYELVYGASSVKHLSAAELETYLQRLEELKVLLANRDSKPEETVEWLVRCA